MLSFVSGLSTNVASNIVEYREKHGPFANREAIRNVSQFGPKTFEQAVGFLRILDSDNPLDKTPIHPESYGLASKILKAIAIEPRDIGSVECQKKIAYLDRRQAAEKLAINPITLDDLLDAFARPTRDLRDQYTTAIEKRFVETGRFEAGNGTSGNSQERR